MSDPLFHRVLLGVPAAALAAFGLLCHFQYLAPVDFRSWTLSDEHAMLVFFSGICLQPFSYCVLEKQLAVHPSSMCRLRAAPALPRNLNALVGNDKGANMAASIIQRTHWKRFSIAGEDFEDILTPNFWRSKKVTGAAALSRAVQKAWNSTGQAVVGFACDVGPNTIQTVDAEVNRIVHEWGLIFSSLATFLSVVVIGCCVFEVFCLLFQLVLRCLPGLEHARKRSRRGLYKYVQLCFRSISASEELESGGSSDEWPGETASYTRNARDVEVIDEVDAMLSSHAAIEKNIDESLMRACIRGLTSISTEDEHASDSSCGDSAMMERPSSGIVRSKCIMARTDSKLANQDWEPTKKAGYLHKKRVWDDQQAEFVPRWQRRWCVTSPHYLRYYNTSSRTASVDLRATIDLNLVSIKQPKGRVLAIAFEGGSIMLKARSEEDALEWCSALRSLQEVPTRDIELRAESTPFVST